MEEFIKYQNLAVHFMQKYDAYHFDFNNKEACQDFVNKCPKELIVIEKTTTFRSWAILRYVYGRCSYILGKYDVAAIYLVHCMSDKNLSVDRKREANKIILAMKKMGLSNYLREYT